MTSSCLLALLLLAVDPIPRPFAIEVLDDQTGRGVPLVELTTTSGITYVTDSAGLVAFDEPGLISQRVYFAVKSHGYEMPQDGFGFRGVRLDVQPGGSATIRIKRRNIAERLYRITGQGIYRDSALLGRRPPIDQPLINAEVAGSDSVQNVIYRGRLYWFWGDTNRMAYPLGTFHTPGAISRLPNDGGLDPAVGVNLEYFQGPDSFAKSTAKMSGEGPTWIDGLTVLKDGSGHERLFAAYSKIKPPLTVYRRGICQWNDEKGGFESIIEYEPSVPLYPFGHLSVRREETGDDRSEYVYFGDPFPLARVRANVEDFLKLDRYEGYTCIKDGLKSDKGEVDRDTEGRPIYRWRRGAPPLDDQGPQYVLRGKLKPEERLVRLFGRASGKAVRAHRGSVNWNDYRQKWIAVFVEQGGTSPLGEVWFAEAESPQGPWTDCVKIVTHDQYSFYNPKQHPYFDQQGGRLIYLEGTYTHTFSGNKQRTPRYDYNQIMYRLDLADERLRNSK